MNLLKYQRGYLGTTDEILDARSSQRCAGTIVGDAAIAVTDTLQIFDGSGGTAHYIDVATLTDTEAVVIYFTGGNIRGVLLSRSGDTLTSVDDVVITAVTGGVTSWPTVKRLTDTTAVLFWRDNTSLKALVITSTGSTLTAGSAVTITASHGTTAPVLLRMTDTTLVAAWIAAGSANISYNLLTESGGTLSAGATTTMTYGENVSLGRIDDTTFLATRMNSPILRVSVGSISGTTISFGSTNDVINPVGGSLGAVNTVTTVDSTSAGWITWSADAVVVRCPYARSGDTVTSTGKTASTVDSENTQNTLDVVQGFNNRLLAAVVHNTGALPNLYSHRQSPVFDGEDVAALDTLAADQIKADTFTSSKIITVHRQTADDSLVAKLSTAT